LVIHFATENGMSTHMAKTSTQISTQISTDQPIASELFRRYEGNPIITAASFPFIVNSVFNPGVTIFDGEVLLLCRVEHRTGFSSLIVARSADGLTNWIIEPDRCLEPLLDTHDEQWGIEDPRITKCGDDYYIVYTGYSSSGPLVCLAITTDFREFRRLGVLSSPEDKDAALFPCQFDDHWVLIHRPVPRNESMGAHMWLSTSPDLRHWGNPQLLLASRKGGWWDSNKIGLCPPPMLTDLGWLLLYHGVRITAAGSLYRLGLALLAKDDPSRVLARSSEWVFGPSVSYEVAGDVPGVVFPCGWVLLDDGDTVRIYYGAADTSIAVADASLRELLEHLLTHGSKEPGFDKGLS
jgi:predicted GH43/DUF377 family glycosyl hydrolase